MDQVRALPLWLDCVKHMQPIQYGQQWPVSFFEEQLDESANTLEFNIGIHNIRVHLERLGYALSGSGLHGVAYCILPASTNEKVIRKKQRSAVRKLKRAVTLGNSTDRTVLSPAETSKLEATTRLASLRFLFMSRPVQIEKAMKKISSKVSDS